MRDKHEIRTEVGVKENCFVHCFKFASEVIIAVPVYRYLFYLLYRSSSSMPNGRKKAC